LQTVLKLHPIIRIYEHMTQPLYAVTLLLTYVNGSITFTVEMRQVVTFNYRELSEHSSTHIRDQKSNFLRLFTFKRDISCIEIRKRKANWIGHILRRNCSLNQLIEGKIQEGVELTRRRERRRRKLLNDLKDRRGYSHLKEEALDRTMWRNRFGGGFGPVFRQNTE
jgi:hypothetical protein